MRISFVAPTINPSGGIKVTLIYAKKLSEMGHEVTVVSAEQKKLSLRQVLRSLLKFEWPKSKPITTLEGWSGNHLILNERQLNSGNAFPDADVVIATWWETAEWIAQLDPSKGAKVYFIQGHEVYDYLPVERVIATYMQPFHRIVISKWLMRALQDSYGIAAPDFVPNSYDKSQFFAPVRHKSSIPTVGFLYSDLRLKGADAVITAIRILKIRFPIIRVVSFGTSAPKDDEAPTEDFEFHLLPKQSDIRTLYSQCDVWLSGSRSEGFNLTALEAMACRTPLVSTKTGWPCDAIIDGENGYLVEVDDISTLVSAAQKVLELPDVEWQQMSLNAFETANFGSWDVSAKAFESSLMRSIQLQSTQSQ